MDHQPGNRQAERGLLGILLNKNDALFEIGQLDKADFISEEAHAHIFGVLKDQIEAGRTVTSINLLFDMQDAEIAEDMTASEYLSRLESEAPPASLAAELANTIRDAALRARIIGAAEEVQRRVMAAPVSIPAATLRDQLDEAISSLFPSVESMGLRHHAEVGDQILERLKVAGNSGQAIGIDVGLKELQDLMGPLQAGRLYCFAGSPGSGKSALTKQVLNAAAGHAPVILFTPEMGADEVQERQLSAWTGVDSHKIERGTADNNEYEQLWIANKQHRSLPFYIDAASKPSLGQIRGKSVRQKRMGGLAAIGIDHVHYMAKIDKRQAEFDALDENLEGLKGTAKDLGIPVIAVCQLGTEALRDMAKWPHRRPTQGDLLYAGIVERHADAIMLIHREEYFLKRNEPAKGDKNRLEWEGRALQMEGIAELILGKRRGGVGFGSRKLTFDARMTEFRSGLPNRSVEPAGLFAA